MVGTGTKWKNVKWRSFYPNLCSLRPTGIRRYLKQFKNCIFKKGFLLVQCLHTFLYKKLFHKYWRFYTHLFKFSKILVRLKTNVMDINKKNQNVWKFIKISFFATKLYIEFILCIAPPSLLYLLRKCWLRILTHDKQMQIRIHNPGIILIHKF